ncbi:MAG: flagellin [Oscillospiraceae bacterium]|nr:flagellin [Oscillospiraceae bacterium]
MIIQHNLMALNAYRQLNGNNSALAKNLEKLSSGYRINRAADDAAGLAISEKMRAQIRGLETAQKNAQDGISLIQTAEGAMTEVHAMLNRMVDLATQAANGIYDDAVDRAALDREFQQLKDEIDRISKSTNFNGLNLLDGSLGSGSTGGGAFKVSGALTNLFTFGNENLNAAIKAEYQTSSSNTANMMNALSASLGDTGFDVTNTNEAQVRDILSRGLGFSLKDYDITLSSTSLMSGVITMTAKQAGADANVDAILLLAKNLGPGGGGFHTAVPGADSYRDITMDIGYKFADSNLINQTVTIAGKIYEFVGQNMQNELGEVFGDTSSPAAANGSKLANGNYGIDISSSYPTGFDLAQIIADAVNNVENTARGLDPSAADALVFATADPAIPDRSPVRITFNLQNMGLVSSAGQNAGSRIGGGGLNLQIGDTGDAYNVLSVNVEDMSTKGLGISHLNIASYEAAVKAVGTNAQQAASVAGVPGSIKGAINIVSAQRAALGALQNRLEHTINNIGVTTENLTAAEARIRDTDMAKEMMMYTKNNILVQASMAMLAQANQVPQGILQLLR